MSIYSTGRSCVLALIALALTGLPVAPAFSQGFMVRPMIVEATPSPGDVIEQSIEIRNTLTQAQRVQVRARELAQASGGAWQAAATESAAEGRRSALDFMELSAEELTLEGRQGGKVDLTFRVPQRARGFYGAALLISSVPPDTAPGSVAMVVQFLIPIIIQIDGRPARENISITDLDMTFVPGGTRAISAGQTREFPPTTEATMKIANTGETLGRVAGELTIAGLVNDQWRHVARLDLRQRSLIPGAEFTMTSDLNRRLPSGQYRLSATMRLGGRFAGRQELILDHEGDPDIQMLATDVPLMIDDLVRVEAAAGGTRSGTLTIENPTDNEVSIATAIATPGGLRGVALGELDGEELSAADWLELNPDRFRLRGGQSRSLRVVSKAPQDLPGHPHYYAELHVGAFYEDGQSAGRWLTIVDASAPGVEATPRAQSESVLVAEGEEGYVVTARFANVGNVHMRPSCEAVLRDGDDVARMRAELTSETRIALPLALMEWSGSLDVSSVAPGTYMLDVTLRYGENATTGRLPVRITRTEDGEMRMTVMQDDAGNEDAADDVE